MKTTKFSKLNILILICIVAMLFSAITLVSNAKYVLNFELDHSASVRNPEYGFQYNIVNGYCYVTGFVAKFDSNNNLLEYNPADPVLGSLKKDQNNRWVLTFPSSYTLSGNTFSSLIVKADAAAKYGFPFYNKSGNRVLMSGNNNTTIQKIVLPYGITHLENNVFFNYTALIEASMADSVVSMGTSAFENCTNLQSIVLSEALPEIKNKTFNKCGSLLSAIVPSQVVSIGSYAFGSCSSMKTIYIPISVTTIFGVTSINGAFTKCTNLEIYVGASAKQSGWGPYWNYRTAIYRLPTNYSYTLEQYLIAIS